MSVADRIWRGAEINNPISGTCGWLEQKENMHTLVTKIISTLRKSNEGALHGLAIWQKLVRTLIIAHVLCPDTLIYITLFGLIAIPWNFWHWDNKVSYISLAWNPGLFLPGNNVKTTRFKPSIIKVWNHGKICGIHLFWPRYLFWKLK